MISIAFPSPELCELLETKEFCSRGLKPSELRVCHSWCRHLSSLNNCKKGLPAAEKGQSVLTQHFSAGTIPPQYHHAVCEKYAASRTPLQDGMKLKLEYFSRKRRSQYAQLVIEQPAYQLAIEGSNHWMERLDGAAATAPSALHTKVHLRSDRTTIQATQPTFFQRQEGGISFGQCIICLEQSRTFI